MAGSDTVQTETEPVAVAGAGTRDAAPAHAERRPLGVRVLRLLPLAPAAAAIAIGLAVVVFSLIWMSLWGVPGSPGRDGLAFLSQQPFWFDVFSAGLLAAGLWLLDLTPSSARRALDELRDRIVGAPEAVAEVTRRATVHSAPGSIAAGLFGALLGVVFTLGVAAALERRGIRWPPGVFGWILVRNACVFGVISQGFFLDVRVGRALARLGAEHLRIGWREVSAAAPLARHGLRLLLGWTVVSCLVAFFLLDEAAAGATLCLLALIVVHALAVIWVPLRGVRQHVRAAKQEELARLDGEIDRVGGAVRDGALPPETGWPRLGAIVAYRGFVAAAPESPIDTPALARLALYLALPLGSWLGGALVERAVGWLLG